MPLKSVRSSSSRVGILLARISNPAATNSRCGESTLSPPTLSKKDYQIYKKTLQTIDENSDYSVVKRPVKMMKALVSVLLWCLVSANVSSIPSSQQDLCSGTAWCGECILQPGCVWCDAPEMASESATRCRAVEAVQDSWCPLLHRHDSSGLLVQKFGLHEQQLGLHEQHFGLHDLVKDTKPGALVSPSSALVITRNDSVEFTFRVGGMYTPNDKVYIWYESSYGEQKDLLRPNWAPLQSDRKSHNVTVNIDVDKYVEGCSEAVLHVGLAQNTRVRVRLRRDCRQCGCSDVEEKSRKCGGRGRMECGVCQCDEGWKGSNCEEELCGSRGDITPNTCLEIGADRNCSGVGVCRCGRCECGPGDFVGDYCRDLCSGTADCALCRYEFEKLALDGHEYHALCSDKCPSEITTRSSTDVRCNVTDSDGCVLSYRVLRPWPYVHALERNCSFVVGAAAGGGGSLMGAVLGGVLGVAVVAGAAALLWHARGGGVDPLAGAQYDQMPATPSQGENPLYKPPVTSYNNPLYRKT